MEAPIVRGRAVSSIVSLIVAMSVLVVRRRRAVGVSWLLVMAWTRLVIPCIIVGSLVACSMISMVHPSTEGAELLQALRMVLRSCLGSMIVMAVCGGLGIGVLFFGCGWSCLSCPIRISVRAARGFLFNVCVAFEMLPALTSSVARRTFLVSVS